MTAEVYGGLTLTANSNNTAVVIDIDNRDTLLLNLTSDNLQGIIGVRIGNLFITLDELDYLNQADGGVTYELHNSGLRLQFDDFKEYPIEVITDTFVMNGETTDGNSYELEDDKLLLSNGVDDKSKVSILSGEYSSIDDMPTSLKNAVIAMAGLLYEDNTIKEIPGNIKGQVEEFRVI